MKKTTAVIYYGNQTKLAEALNIAPASISQWGDVIPEKQALLLEKLTEGSLKYDPALYKKYKKVA